MASYSDARRRNMNNDLAAARAAYEDDRQLTGTTATSAASGRSAYSHVCDPNAEWENDFAPGDDSFDESDGENAAAIEVDIYSIDGGDGPDPEKTCAELWASFWHGLCCRVLGLPVGPAATLSVTIASLRSLDSSVQQQGGLSVECCRRLNVFDPSAGSAQHDGHADCAICVGDLAVDAAEQPSVHHVAIELPCEHKFHAMCLEPWLRRQSTCPLCRLNLSDALTG